MANRRRRDCVSCAQIHRQPIPLQPKVHVRIVLWLLLFSGPGISFAQQQWMVQQHIGLKEGLPQTTVRDICYDRFGYLWLATEGGLARWDGKTVKVFNRKNAPDYFQSGRVAFISQDKSDNCIFVPENYPTKLLQLTGPFSFKWVFRDSGDRYYGQAAYRVFNIKPISDFLKANNHQEILREVEKSFFVGISDNGITGTLLFEHVMVWYDGKSCVIDSFTNRYHKSDSSNIFFASGATLFYINPVRGLFRRSQHKGEEKVASGSLLTYLNTLTRREKVAIKIFQLQGKPLLYVQNKFFLLKDIYGVPEIELLADQLTIPAISTAVYHEETGSLTVGTFATGAYILRRNHFQSLRLPEPLSRKDAKANIFYSVHPFHNDRVLTNKGVFLLADGSFRPLDRITFGAIGKAGNRFVMQEVESLVALDSSLQHSQALCPAKSFEFNGLESIADSVLLILSTEHLLRYNFKTRSVDTPINNAGTEELLNCILPLNIDKVLVGSYKGMSVYSLRDKRNQKIAAFNNINIRTLYRDKKGVVWVGTTGNGYYSMYKGQIVHYPSDLNHNLDVINGFIEDGSGYLWLSTNNGLFRFANADLGLFRERKKDKLFYNYFDQTDGLPINEFNHGSPSAIALENKRLAFGSMDGIIVASIARIKFRNPLLKVSIDNIMVDTQIVSPTSKDEIAIPPGVEQLQFEVSTPYAGNPYEIQLYYSLSGGEKIWIPVPADGKILFNRLGSGDYKLEFRLVRSLEDAYSAISFRILPRWFERTSTKIAFGFLLLGLAILGYLYGTRILRRQKQRLEVIVKDRTKELDTTVVQLTDTVDRLRTSEEELYQTNKQKEQLSAIAMHDIQSPLKFLSGIADRMYKNINEGQTRNLDEMAFELRNATKQIAEFSNDYLNWLKSNQSSVRKEKTSVDVGPLIRGIADLFTELAKYKGNELNFKVQEGGLKINTVKDYLGIVIRNLVDNANKYTKEGQIFIDAYEEQNIGIIRVRDTGSGMRQDQLDILSGKSSTVSTEGLGLRIIHDLMIQCSGSIIAESTSGRGTTITLQFG